MNVSHPVGQALTAVTIAIVIGLSTATVSANPQADNAHPFAHYVGTDQGKAYQPVDPVSLENVGAGGALTFDHEWPQLAVSADGSTFATINPSQGPLDRGITVRDGIEGTVIQTITPDEAVFNPRLNADGSRLIAEPTMICGPTGCGERTWYTWDTRTGQLMATTRADLGAPVWPDLVDPAGGHLYYAFYKQPGASTSTPESGVSSAVGPWPLQIARYDLTTGLETARITVPEVLAGSWQVESIDQMYVGEMMNPAVALAPDGSRLAVADAAMEQLTIVDAATLTVLDTHTIHRPKGLADRLLGWLGIIPQSAQAKVSEGGSIRATFSADGRHLYLSGHEIDIGKTIDDITGHGMGISKIEVSTGQMTAVTLEGHDAEVMIAAPDGQSLYILMPEQPWWDNGAGSKYLLCRLDAGTLETMSERLFDTWPQIMLVPRGGAEASH